MKKFSKNIVKILSFALIIVCSFFAFSGCVGGFSNMEEAASYMNSFKGIKALYLPQKNRTNLVDETEANIKILSSFATEILYKLAVNYGLGYADISGMDYYGVEEKLALAENAWVLEDGIVKTKVTENAVVSFPTDIRTKVDYSVTEFIIKDTLTIPDETIWKLTIEEGDEKILTLNTGTQYFIDENENSTFDNGEELYHISEASGLTAFRDFNGNGILNLEEEQLGTLNSINEWVWNLSEALTAEDFITNYIATYKNKLVAEMLNITFNTASVTELNFNEKAQDFTYYGLTQENITALKAFVKNTVIGNLKVIADNGYKNDADASKDIVKIISTDGNREFYVFDVNQNGSSEIFDDSTNQIVHDNFKNYNYMVDTIVDESAQGNLESQFGTGNTYIYNVYIQNYSGEYIKQRGLGEEEWVIPSEHYIGFIYCLDVDAIGANQVTLAYTSMVLESDYGQTFADVGFGFKVFYSPKGTGYTITKIADDPVNVQSGGEMLYSYFNGEVTMNLTENWNDAADRTSGGSPTLTTPGTPIKMYNSTTKVFNGGMVASIGYGAEGLQYVDSNNDVLSLIFTAADPLPINFSFTLKYIWDFYLEIV